MIRWIAASWSRLSSARRFASRSSSFDKAFSKITKRPSISLMLDASSWRICSNRLVRVGSLNIFVIIIASPTIFWIPLALVWSLWTAECRILLVAMRTSCHVLPGISLTGLGEISSPWAWNSFIHFVSSAASGHSQPLADIASGSDVVVKLKQHSSRIHCTFVRIWCCVSYGRYMGYNDGTNVIPVPITAFDPGPGAVKTKF